MGFFLTLFLFAAFTVLGELLRPKPDLKNAKPAGLGEFQFPTATEARRVPLLWGTVQVRGPNVVWYGDLLQDPITEKVKTGLFSSETIIKGYRYYVGMQFVPCAGEVDGLRRMWLDDELVVDATASLITHGDTFTINEPNLFGGEDLGRGGFIGTFKFFAGTADQTASSYLSTFQLEGGDTPAYRGFCYIAPDSEAPYVGSSTSISAPRFEVQRIEVSEANGLGLADPTVNDLDANPMNVLYEVATNTEWGRKIPPSKIGTTSWIDAANTLKDEGNGFSFLLDTEEPIDNMLQRLYQQIDGLIYLDESTGKYEAVLARDDYDPDTLPEFNDDNIVEVVTFSRITYSQTSNIASVEFVDRSDSYKTTFATLQNDANIYLQGGNEVFSADRYGGVKEGALASVIVSRDLRTESAPLAQARITTDRTTYLRKPLDVVKVSFTRDDFVVTDLVMRIKGIDRGDLLNGRITYELVEDVFFAGLGLYGTPPPSAWVPPVDTLVPLPDTQQLSYEAPRGLTLRDPGSEVPETDKVFSSARKQGVEVMFDVYARHAAGTPSGDYDLIGKVFQFCRMGTLTSDLGVGSTVPLTSLTIDSTPDTQANILANFESALSAAPTDEEMGIDLLGLIQIDDEFMLVSWASTNGARVDLERVFRGVMDSVQQEHSAGAEVFLLFTGAGMSVDTIGVGQNVEVALLPRSYSDAITAGEATTITFTMENRTRRPYAPSEFDLNGVRFDSVNVDLDGEGSGEDVGVFFDEINRRDFRTENEVASLENDAATLATDYPTANASTHLLIVKAGMTELVAQSIGTATSGTVRQLDILQALDTTTLPSSLTFGVRASHTFEGDVLTSRYDCEVTSTIVSDLIGEHAFGALDTNDVSTVYEVVTGDDSTDHTFTLSSAFTAGDVEYRINGGSWTTLVAAGVSSGSIPSASLSVGDDIEIRHLSSDSNAQKLCTLTVGANVRGYAVLYT